MNTGEYSDPKFLDNLVYFLNKPNTDDRSGFLSLGSKLLTNISRVGNRAFKDGVWYDEAKARELLLDYINNPEITKQLSPQHQKIMQIYDRLAHIRRGEGTWADGIDQELLNAKEPESKRDEELHLPKIREMILEDVFIQDAPEEQIFEEKAVQDERVVDEKGQSYTFTYQERMEPPSTRMLFHIQADEFGSSSELEGGQSTECVSFLHKYCANNPTFSKDLVNQLAGALCLKGGDSHYDLYSFNKKVENAKEKIEEAFDSQNPLLIMGGWTGTPSGHAIYYEVIPHSDKTASFRLYNTGAGVGSHPSDIKGHKVKYQTFCEWEGIDREKLESPLFLEALYELTNYDTLALSHSKTEYGEQDVYRGLRELLQPKNVVEREVDATLFMTPQRSGVCAWKSLMAFLRTKMDLNDYKRFKCDMKLQSLLDFVKNHKGDVDPMVWRLVKRSHQNLCQSIVKLHQRKLVGDPYIQKAEEELRSISNWIKGHAECRYRRPVQEIPSRYTHCVEEQDIENQHAFSKSLNEIQEMEQSSGGKRAQPFQHTLEGDVSKLEELIDQAKRAWENHEDLALHKGLIDFVTGLEMDENFWQQRVQGKKEAAEKLIAQLGELAQFFTKSCFTVPDSKIIFSEKVYFFSKVLHLQELICRITHPKWKNLWLVQKDRDNLFLRFPNAKMHREMENILLNRDWQTQFRMDSYRSSNYSISGICKSDDVVGLSFKFNKSDGKPSENRFVDILRKDYPECIRDISGFRDLAKFAQDAEIYASPNLPDWIKAMRDTQLAFYHLKESNVGPLVSLDREADLTPQFKVEKKEEKSIVTITLKGALTVEGPCQGYEGQYRKIANPNIQKLVKHLSRERLSEKKLANTHSKKLEIEMPDEEFREVTRLFAKPGLQLIETLEYFSKHPEKFQDMDYQTLFHVLLFQTGLLDKSLAIEGFGNRLAGFIRQNYEQFSEENQIQPAVFLLKVAHQLQGFCPEQDFFESTVEKLTALLTRKGLGSEMKSLVYAELVAELGHKEDLDEEEIAHLIEGSIYVDENQSQSKYPADPSTQKEGREALLIHAKAMQQALEKGNPNQKLLNRILGVLRPNAKDEKWVMNRTAGEFPVFETEGGSHVLYPLNSQLLSKGADALLPLNVRQNPLFQKLFPGIEQGSLQSGNVFSVGNETLVSLNGDHLVVEQKQEGEWVRYVPTASFLNEDKSLLGSRYLVHHYTHWQSLEQDKIYAVDPKSGERCYEIAGKEVKDLKENLLLGKPSSLFATFEDPAYIHEWYDDAGQLKKIELPRFNLTFRPGPRGLLCEQFPNHVLNVTDSVKKLGIHHHYILLGDEKILLPRQGFRSAEKKEVLQPRYELNQQLKLEELDPQKYYVFEVQKKGRLYTKSREANLYLAEVLTAAQEYKKAARYLLAYGHKLSLFTAKEAEILNDLANMDQITGDKSGDGTALQLYAGFLRLKNSFSHHLELSNEEITELKNHYDHYINQYYNVTVLKLQPDEEILLLKVFLSKEFDPVHFMRLKELDPIAAQKLEVLVDVKKEKIKTLEGFKIPDRFRGDSFDRKPLSGPLLTRPHEAINGHFLYFYDIARKGKSDEQERLRASLVFVRLQNSGMANFFEAVLKNPSVFPEPISNSEKMDVKEKWIEDLFALAEKEVAKLPAETEVIKSKSAKGFQLEKKQLEKAPVELNITLPVLTEFANDCFTEMPKKEKKDNSELAKLLTSCKSDDPVQNREVNRLVADLEHYDAEPLAPTYIVDREKAGQILEKDKIADKAAMQQLEEDILALANKTPNASTQLQRWGKLRKVITLEELIICFARNNFHQLIDKKDIHLIAEKVGAYLLYATRDQKRERAEKEPEAMLAKREYDPLERPAYLAFEYFANISMRKAQVEKLEKFLSGGELNLVMEMIMGSGKSKVLLPLLGLLRADGKTLSMLIVPQPLFESVSQDTQEILQSFSQSLSALHFDRHTQFTKERLEAIYDQLKAVRQNRECLIMTSKSVQCLLIKFVEECAKNMEFSIEVKLMQKILKLLSESGYPIIDEADTVLNVLHEVSFSGGGRLSPKKSELEFLSELYGLIDMDTVMTEELYEGQVKVPLANALVDRLGKNFDAKKRELLFYYLCRDKAHIKEAQAFFDGLDEEVQDIVALAAEQISHLLPYTLTRICDEKYGLDNKSNNPLAIPYSAAREPSSGSQFSNPYITMNYTFQTYMIKGVTSEIIEDQIALLQEKAMREIAASGGKLLAKQTVAGQVFTKLKGRVNMPLFNYKRANIDELTESINDSSELKRFFVSSVILPQLEQFECKMSCNPHNLVAFFRKAAGFTGTLWNGTSMHHTLKPEPAVGTDAKTLSILWANSRDNILTVEEGTLDEMLTRVKNFDMISDAGGYFKAGTNSEMAHKIAANRGKEVVFYNAKGEQTITDGSSEIPLSQSDSDERLTFLDQSHTTGADVPQKEDAVSIVTIGRSMLLRDLLQSVWRLRGLEKSQRVQFLVSDEVAGIMRQKLDLDADHPIELATILKFVITNQSSQQGRDNYKALKEGFANISQKILLEVFLNEKLKAEARMQAFSYLETTWIKPAIFSPRELYGTLTQEVEGKKVLELDKRQYVGKIKELFKKMPWLEKIGITEKECLEEIDLIVSNIQESLPAKLQVPAKEIEDDETVEVETEIKTETERETELEVQAAVEKEEVLIHDVKGEVVQECDTFAQAIKIIKTGVSSSGTGQLTHVAGKLPIFPLKSFLETDEHLKPFATAFERIHIALNVLEWTSEKSQTVMLDQGGDYKLLGSYRTDFHHLLVKDSKVTLLTQAEASLFYDSPNYYNLTLGFNDPNKKLSQDEQFKIVKLKFLNGESQYNQEELKLLKLWFKGQGVKKMQKLFVEDILAGFPRKATRYQDSPLQQLFSSL